ncbi:MAG: hypothetical protein JSS46_01250 [Proteobacteria bacterium]|jgi:Tfp pilus assembly protein PilX|nr:hypothetical protein [Pseudomonadota bacterium]
MSARSIHGRITRATQRGVSLFITLIAVVLLTFAGLALLRAVDTSTLITGNLQFQEAALASGNAGTEAAITWLAANSGGSNLFADASASGYYSTSADGCNLTVLSSSGATNYVDWLGVGAATNCNMVPVSLASTANGVAAGYTVEYVINRMCNAPGDPNAVAAADGVTPMICASYVSPSTSKGSTQVGASYGSAPLSGLPQHYYRITTRTTGPRNTVRYTQAFVVL